MTTPNPDPFDLVGTTIAGKYDVDQVVARTALSVVYRATHRVWQRNVAIKAFTAPMLSEESRHQLLASFVEEGRLLMDLSERCAAICQARDVSSLTTANGDWVPYTVLEWLDGECLEIVMRRERAEGVRPRTLAESIALLHPIADALAIAHERGVVHRDVKPGNIFLIQDAHDGSLRTKLLDFGVAKVLRGVPTGLAVSQSFTPSYGAPEQFSSAYGTTGPWTDVFALALIIVELLTGHEALEGEDVGTLGLQSCDASRRPTPRTQGAVVGDDVEFVLGRALAVNPEDRFLTVREFWDSLLAALVAQDGADIEITWDADAEDPSTAEVDALLGAHPPEVAPVEGRASLPSDSPLSSGPRESYPSQPPISSEPRESYPSQPPSSDDPRLTPTSLVGATLPFGINVLREVVRQSAMEK